MVVGQKLYVLHDSKSIKGINAKVGILAHHDKMQLKDGILAHHDKMQLKDKGHNSESHSFGVMPFFNLIFYVE